MSNTQAIKLTIASAFTATVMFAVAGLTYVGAAPGNGSGGGPKAGYCVWTTEEEHDEETLTKIGATSENEEPVVDEGVPTWRWRGEKGESTTYFPYTGDLKLKPKDRSAWCVAQRTVTPDAVTFVDPTCDKDGSYTIPDQDGVVYYIGEEVVAAGTYDAEDGDTVTVTAKAADTWYLTEESTTEWTHDFVNNEDCTVVVEEEDKPQVLAAQVTQTPTGSANAGGAGQIALFGLAASFVVAAFGAVARKFSRI